MAFDYYYDQQHVLRKSFNKLVSPLHWVIIQPNLLMQTISEHLDAWSEKKQIIQASRLLQEKYLKLGAKLQILEALESENRYLRELVTQKPIMPVQPIVSIVKLMPLSKLSDHWKIIPGSEQGIKPGFFAVDATGLVGQIQETVQGSSRLRLITSPMLKIPVRSVRTNRRAVISGLGNGKYLKLEYFGDFKNLKLGEQFVTSGLAGQYLPNYPVGEIIEIQYGPERKINSVILKPLSNLEQGRELLLIHFGKFNDES
jgi:rod shape-determining protein MreC